MSEVIIYQIPNHPRSTAVCQAFAAGIKKVGDKVRVVSSVGYRRPEADIAIFYGLANRLWRVMKDYSKPPRTAIYVDLGYWGRKDGGRFAGYHKISVNDRHPTGYFQKHVHDGSRAAAFGVKAEPWRNPDKLAPIVIAGMGPKGARAEGFNPGQWERDIIFQLRQVTQRPIVYRPKPNWLEARPIVGAKFDPPDATPLEKQLLNCHALVSHHSNAGVEALVAGVPTFTTAGVALPLGIKRLADIDAPRQPEGREQWINDIAYCQWSVPEMAQGLPWRHLKDEGLV